MIGNESETPDYDLRHYMRDALVLLGCPLEIADLLDKSKDLGITTQDVDAVRRYCASLTEGLKDRLTSVHKMRLALGDSSEPS